jgi:hypothetical protein
MKPSFVYIGPPKSASTWLYEELRAHPEVEVPSLKDIYFFDRFYHRGFDWYEKHFKGGPNIKASGELSHDYMFSADVAERMAIDVPEAKLIVILRHPFERALSEYRFLQRSGLSGSSFAEAVKQHDSIIGKSLYGQSLTAFYDRFPSSQIGVFIFNDLVESPKEFANSIFRFIGVEPRSALLNREPVNAQTSARMPLLSRLVKVTADAARDIGLGSLVGVLKRSKVLQSLLYREGEKGKVEIPRQLFDQMQSIFERDITELEKVSGKTFDEMRDYQSVMKKILVT